jgi:hypothetical protein
MRHRFDLKILARLQRQGANPQIMSKMGDARHVLPDDKGVQSGERTGR